MATSGFSAAMAEKDRSNELIEIIGTDAEEELVKKRYFQRPRGGRGTAAGGSGEAQGQRH